MDLHEVRDLVFEGKTHVAVDNLIKQKYPDPVLCSYLANHVKKDIPIEMEYDLDALHVYTFIYGGPNHVNLRNQFTFIAMNDLPILSARMGFAGLDIEIDVSGTRGIHRSQGVLGRLFDKDFKHIYENKDIVMRLLSVNSYSEIELEFGSRDYLLSDSHRKHYKITYDISHSKNRIRVGEKGLRNWSRSTHLSIKNMFIDHIRPSVTHINHFITQNSSIEGIEHGDLRKSLYHLPI